MIDSKLITLLTVNELHSFTQTAKKLSLTQPAVSQHVRQLEKELGVTIFTRGEGNLKLTREGEIVIKYAKRIDSLYQNLEQSLKEEKEHARKITVGITHTSESNIMVEVLARYSSVSKKTRITIISDTINNLYMKLKTYEIDLAIVEGRISDSNFNAIMLDTDSLILAVSNKNPLSRKSMVTLNELKKENLILRLPDSGTRNLFISHLESNNVSLDEFNVILEVDNVATIKDLVRRDFGVSILARSACANELKKGKLIGLPIENLSMTREINMVYHTQTGERTKSGKEGLFMIYLMLVCAVVIVLLLFTRSEYRTMQLMSMFLVLFFFIMSLCFFILYFCKSSFNLSIFLKYFLVPRGMAARLYSLKISKEAIINCLNLSCIFFTVSNLIFAASFMKQEERKKYRKLYPVIGLFFLMEYLVCSPAVYIRTYSFLYPGYMTVSGIERLWGIFSAAISIINLILLFMCLGSILLNIIRVPHIKVYRMSLIIVLFSYFMLIICYLMFMGRLPMQMIKYSKAMDVVTYKILFMNSYIPLYRALPYIILLFILLMIAWSYRLNVIRNKMENYSLEVSQNINAVNMSTRVFCHFMKNELLNLQAEVESLEVLQESEEDKSLLVEHCEALYERLDDIHRHIRDNTMNFRQLQLGGLVRETVEELKGSRPETDIEWSVSVPGEDPCVFADEEFIKQALINLLNNACDALKQTEDKDKKIQVMLLEDSRWGIIEITDNGCGIAKEDMVNIFTPFFTSKPMTKSWGMGLSLTHKIITDSGGKIDVESEVGKGTVFHVYLPVSRI